MVKRSQRCKDIAPFGGENHGGDTTRRGGGEGGVEKVTRRGRTDQKRIILILYF